MKLLKFISDWIGLILLGAAAFICVASVVWTAGYFIATGRVVELTFLFLPFAAWLPFWLVRQ